MNNRIILFFLVSTCISNAFANSVPFKYPSVPAKQFEEDVNNSHDRTAVILGGGPSGLLSAIVLKKTGNFDYIIVIEKRDTYSRGNTVTFRPESMTALNGFGLVEKLQSDLIFSNDFRFFLKLPHGPLLIEEVFSGNPNTIDYNLSIKEAFDRSGWPHFAIKISDFEKVLADELQTLENVFLLQGETEVLRPVSTANMNSVKFISASAQYQNFIVPNPQLLIVAEGSKSPSRVALGISFTPAFEARLPERWCSGVVSLAGIMKSEDINGHITLINNDLTGQVAFGVFRPKEQDLFLNGKMTEDDSKTWDKAKCLQENAHWILKEELGRLKITLPSSTEAIQVQLDQSDKFDIQPKKSDRFFADQNAIVIGDTAADGSPIGGLGISLVTSAYVDALTKLVQNLSSPEMTRQLALEAYARRVDEIVHYRHFSLER